MANRITGGNRAQRKVVREVLAWYEEKQNTALVGSVRLTRLEFGFTGFCVPLRKGVRIELEKRAPLLSLVRTLLHERVHADQFADGRLKVRGERFYWKGKLCTLSYSRQPWEREAFRKEAKLFNALIQEF